MKPTIQLNCLCIKLPADTIYSWWRDINHTDVCRAFRRQYPECIEKVHHEPTERMKMSADTFDQLFAFEPVSAWRWRWRKQPNAWMKVLFPNV